jgi:hypothetical protein
LTTENTPNPRKLRTDAFRMSFPNILTVRVNKDDDGKETRRFELTMLFPPGTNMKPYEDALYAAMVDKHGADPKAWPKLKRGKNEVIQDFAEYNSGVDKPLPGDWTGWKMIRANAGETKQPGVVGPTKGADGKFPVIRDAREVYGGRWARATVEAFYYANKKGGKGVTFGLLNVQLLKHDQPFGAGRAVAEDDFDDASPELAGNDDWGTNEGASTTGNEGGGW